MTLSIRMEVEVDQAAWQAEYGTAGDANDVEDYVLGQLTQSPAADAGCFQVTGYAAEELR